MSTSTSTSDNKEQLRLLVDQRIIYTRESLGSIMIRGEVVVNFPKDTMVLGNIQLVFEGMQRYYTWPGIIETKPVGEEIETKLRVIELSLLPPNSSGIMPAGIQRFPFEFPVPTDLPTSLFIKDRIEIFYQIRASLTKSIQANPGQRATWMARVRQIATNKKLVACTSIRIIRSLETIMLHNTEEIPHWFSENTNQITSSTEILPAPTSSGDTSTTSIVPPPSSSSANTLFDTTSPRNNHNSNQVRGTLDEQHDLLAFSLAGRSTDNYNSCEKDFKKVHNIRYKIGIDRIAIVLGTSVGIELMIEPTVYEARIQSIKLDILEDREYQMKISDNDSFEDLRYSKEGVNMVLKWAYGYPIHETGQLSKDDEILLKEKGRLVDSSDRYVFPRVGNKEHISCFDAMSSTTRTQKAQISLGTNNASSSNIKKVLEAEEHGDQSVIAQGSLYSPINLKSLDQSVKVGEYFGGRFVMPVPDCYSIMNPSMVHDSIKISHWLRLVVTVACNGEVFDISLESPMHMLDCRLVTFGDETILPPPPSYDPTTSNQLDLSWSGTFWEQRERITSEIGFGACYPCPCELRKNKDIRLPNYLKENHLGFSKKSNVPLTRPSYPSTLMPEWGPPPNYRE